jgi:hypothetical protein
LEAAFKGMAVEAARRAAVQTAASAAATVAKAAAQAQFITMTLQTLLSLASIGAGVAAVSPSAQGTQDLIQHTRHAAVDAATGLEELPDDAAVTESLRSLMFGAYELAKTNGGAPVILGYYFKLVEAAVQSSREKLHNGISFSGGGSEYGYSYQVDHQNGNTHTTKNSANIGGKMADHSAGSISTITFGI